MGERLTNSPHAPRVPLSRGNTTTSRHNTSRHAKPQSIEIEIELQKCNLQTHATVQHSVHTIYKTHNLACKGRKGLLLYSDKLLLNAHRPHSVYTCIIHLATHSQPQIHWQHHLLVLLLELPGPTSTRRPLFECVANRLCLGDCSGNVHLIIAHICIYCIPHYIALLQDGKKKLAICNV